MSQHNRCSPFLSSQIQRRGAIYGGAETHGPPPTKSKVVTKEKIPQTVLDFLQDTLTQFDIEHVKLYNGNPVYFTPNFPIPKGAAFCCGITIGEVKKNYLQPHHQFFMAMGRKFKRKIELSLEDKRLSQYLQGEEIPTDCENGWAVITVVGCPLGGVKVSGGKAKNHYPKGLRFNG